MSALDEVDFADALLAIHPSTRFVSMDEQAETGRPRFRSRIDECKGAHVTIVDSSIVPEGEFTRATSSLIHRARDGFMLWLDQA